MSKVNELKELEDLGKPIYVNKLGLTEVEKEKTLQENITLIMLT